MKSKNSLLIIITLLIGIFFWGCSSLKNNNYKPVSKLVFQNYYVITEEGKKSAKVFKDSIIASVKRERGLDSIPEYVMKSIPSYSDMIKMTPRKEIIIEKKNDTVWKYEKMRGKIINDYIRIDKKNNKLFFHSKSDKKVINRESNINRSDGDFIIKKFVNDKKTIQGFQCFRVIVEQNGSFDPMPDYELKVIYDMYVTKEIDFPAYYLLQLTVDEPLDFCPISVNINSNMLSGNIEKYELKYYE